jgi:hypothetical protein
LFVILLSVIPSLVRAPETAVVLDCGRVVRVVPETVKNAQKSWKKSARQETLRSIARQDNDCPASCQAERDRRLFALERYRIGPSHPCKRRGVEQPGEYREKSCKI